MRYAKLIQTIAIASCLWGMPPLALASKHKEPASLPVVSPKSQAGVAEARLIEIYSLIGRGAMAQALEKAHRLVSELPNFQLAQLVYGDLLAARIRPVKTVGDIAETLDRPAQATLDELREESRRRLQALKEKPAAGTVPTQFLALSPVSKHAIAVDASRSRLYLFANAASGLKLISDFYISVGKAGISKSVEGDQRTPLGVYYVTSYLDKSALRDFYGSGALPINYPNVLDAKRGKTGGGIWLHGSPPDQFARAPQSTDGCVVLANPDLEHILRTVEIRTTPVVIAQQLLWVDPQKARNDSKPFEDVLHAWRDAKMGGDLNQLLSFYAPDFDSNGKNLLQWTPVLKSELAKIRGRAIQLKDVSYLRWTDTTDTMVVTFGEVADGARTGWTKRQYWMRNGNQWKIFFEGIV